MRYFNYSTGKSFEEQILDDRGRSLEPRHSYADERSSSVSLLSLISFFLSFFLF